MRAPVSGQQSRQLETDTRPFLFRSQSLKLKTSYIEQLRNEDLISASFLPSIFKVLGVTGARGRPFELAPWAVDEFMLEREWPRRCSVRPVMSR